MRVRMNQIIAFNRDRRHKEQKLKADPGNAEIAADLSEINSRLINLLVEEMLDLNRDVLEAKTLAQRAGRFGR